MVQSTRDRLTLTSKVLQQQALLLGEVLADHPAASVPGQARQQPGQYGWKARERDAVDVVDFVDFLFGAALEAFGFPPLAALAG